VGECTYYEDKRLASKKEMEDIAWYLTTRKSGRSVGFVSAAKFQELKLEAEESSHVNKEQTKRRNDGPSLTDFPPTLEMRSHEEPHLEKSRWGFFIPAYFQSYCESTRDCRFDCA
jgi:hypothetical protein